ncbi:hypothetical protein E1A91_D13G038300v1 [Gossypium mustelinum]|uniref:non-specific serine/threonine protein kinase n=1 Tax=Gossypium mustelinum TaxID=34275 RepID=A0A5D2S1D6_GOSMU|nr:hypothetical protein E1A91_D13G038300v1 [Gossypium mustelinum]
MGSDAPEGSPPSPTTTSSPPQSSSDNSSPPSQPPPSQSASPPPESSSSKPGKSAPPPNESKSTSSSPPPPSPPPPPESTPSPPPPSPSPPPSPPPPSKSSNAPPTKYSPPQPKLTPPSTPTTQSPPSKHSPPPPKWHSSSSNSESGSKSNTSASLPIILGLLAGVVLLLIIITTIITVACCRKKKKANHDNPMQYYNNYTPSQGDGGYGNASSLAQRGQMNNGYEANNHIAINLPPPPYGTNAGHGGGWPQTPPTQRQTPSTQGYASYSSEMSPNMQGQVLPPPPAYASPSPLGLINQSSFSYEELAMATHGFSQANLLGQGGFGYVHKGVLANGKEVAVKSLKSGSRQGQGEFQAEVETISRVHHRHLVSLVGYCIAGERRMLVYEFLPNKTLEFHLHDKCPMDWPTRLKIALGAAKGLAYLHEDCYPGIIHRDIKSANILLDFTFKAKVSDFGLAKLTQDNNTHVSTRVMGTFGYLAPEYASSGKLTEKSDVFSFGVVLLELITGRRPLDLNSNMDDSLVDWARPLCERAMENGNFGELVDRRLENNFVHHEMVSMVACASASIRHSARRRPKMRQIVRALEDDVPLDEINGVVAAGQSSRFSTTNDTSEYNSSSYSADMRRFRQTAMTDSQEHPSNNYGNTSEYGHNSSSSSSSSNDHITSTRTLT